MVIIKTANPQNTDTDSQPARQTCLPSLESCTDQEWWRCWPGVGPRCILDPLAVTDAWGRGAAGLAEGGGPETAGGQQAARRLRQQLRQLLVAHLLVLCRAGQTFTFSRRFYPKRLTINTYSSEEGETIFPSVQSGCS